MRGWIGFWNKSGWGIGTGVDGYSNIMECTNVIMSVEHCICTKYFSLQGLSDLGFLYSFYEVLTLWCNSEMRPSQPIYVYYTKCLFLIHDLDVHVSTVVFKCW